MKKIFTIIAVALMALALSSCKKGVSGIDASKLDNTVEKCWHCTCKATVSGISATSESYAWGTERGVVLALQESEKYSSGHAKWTYEAAPKYKDYDTCLDANAAVE